MNPAARRRRIAVIMSGYLRTIRENITAIRQNIMQDCEVEFYVHITTGGEEKYGLTTDSADFICREFTPRLVLVSGNLPLAADPTTNDIFNQNYKFYWLNQERKRMAAATGADPPDIIVKIRPDLHLQTPLNYENVQAGVYVPDDSKIDRTKLAHPNDPHICDILAYGTPAAMDVYFDFYTRLPEIYAQTPTHANETLLWRYLDATAIPIHMTPLNYYVILSTCNIINITGDSGSGKSTVAEIIRGAFSRSFILECDRYHKWERGHDEWTRLTHLHPEANYLLKMEKDVFDLKIGNDVYQVDYDHKTGKFTDPEKIKSTDNIIVCGLHGLKNSTPTLKIYMDTDPKLSTAWKIKRDMEKRGHTREKVLEQIRVRQKDYETYILPQKAQADIIIRMEAGQSNELSPVHLKVGFSIDRFDVVSIQHTFGKAILDQAHCIIDFGPIGSSPENLRTPITKIIHYIFDDFAA